MKFLTPFTTILKKNGKKVNTVSQDTGILNTLNEKKYFSSIFPQNINEKLNYIVVNDWFLTTLYFKSYPDTFTSRWLDVITDEKNHPYIFDLSVTVYPTSADLRIKDLEKLIRVSGERLEKLERQGVEDKELLRKNQDAINLKQILSDQQFSLFIFGIAVTIRAKSLEELWEIKKMLARQNRKFGENTIYDYANTQQLQGFQSTLPIFQDKITYPYDATADMLSTFFPFYPERTNLEDENGFVFGMNKKNGKMIFFNFKEMYRQKRINNLNISIWGTTGGGKSSLMRSFIHRSFQLKNKFFILDPKSDYDLHAKDYEGQAINFDLSHGSPFNLFEIYKDEELRKLEIQDGASSEYIANSDEWFIRNKMISIRAILSIVIKDLVENKEKGIPANKIKASILDMALKLMYKKDPTGKKLNMDLLYQIIKKFNEKFSKTEKDKRKFQISEDLLYDLEDFKTGGTQAGLFKKNPNMKNFDPNCHYTVFNFRALENAEEAKGIASFLALEYSWEIIRKMDKNSFGDYGAPYILIDEGWDLLRYPEIANYVLKIFRLIRGRANGGIIVATQTAADFLKTNQGKGILENSDTIIYLKQRDTGSEILQKLTKLNDDDFNFLQTAPAGEGIIQFPGRKIPFRSIRDDSWEYRKEYEPGNRES